MNDHTDTTSAFADEAKPEEITAEWAEIASAPNTGCRAQASEPVAVNVAAALEWGGVGGGVVGVAWVFLTSTAFWPTVLGAALAGAVLWATLTAAVAALADRRGAVAGLAAGLCQLARGVVATVYVAAVLVVAGYVIHTKVKLNSAPRNPTPVVIPPATVN